MTLFRAAPYPDPVIRPSPATFLLFVRARAGLAGCCALALWASGCATDVVTRSEHAELLSSMRAIRAENARLEARLEKLEQQQLLLTTRAAQVKTSTTQSAPASVQRAPSTQATAATTSADALPPLAVVKLKPRREAAPKLNTAVEVTEPDEAISGELQQPSNDPDTAAMAEIQYDRGLDLLKTGDLEGGLSQLTQFVTDWPRHPKADNALYFVGLARLNSGDAAQAIEPFTRVLKSYPAGDAVVDSMLKLADCHARLKQKTQARALWQQVIDTYPGTSAASQAQVQLSKAP